MKLYSAIAGVVGLPDRNEKAVLPRFIEGPTIEQVASKGALREGWSRVRVNKGGAGGDGVTLENFARNLDRNLDKLGDDLLTGIYLPARLRRVTMPKVDGGSRRLSIPSVVDRVAQAATLIVLTPTLDPRMSEASWAYRPGRGVKDALAGIASAFEEGFVWTVDADITKYFDRVPQQRLIDELTIWIDDERVIRLFGLWLKSFNWRGYGIAQGSPISPLLANLYLHPVDRLIAASGYPLVRYADDLVILTRTATDAETALKLLKSLLTARGLTLNGMKTSIRSPDETFRFLGQQIRAKTRAA